MRIDPLEYRRPNTVEEALTLLADHGGEAKVLGGGTDLVARLKLGILSPKMAVDVTGLPELKYVRNEAGALAVGAATPLRAVETSQEVKQSFPSLAAAAASVASFQIRSVGTLGGNVCLETMCWFYNQSRQWKKSRALCYKAGGEPCHVVNKPGVCFATYRGDTAVALIALGAEAKIRSQGKERVVALEDLFTGDGKSPLSLAPTEFITEFRIPRPARASGSSFCKVSHRNAVDYAQASVAATLSLEPSSGRCADARLVLGAVDTRPVRATRAEALLRGKELTPTLLEEAAEAAVSDARPMKNMTFGSPTYRRKMVRTLGRKALGEAWEQARRLHVIGKKKVIELSVNGALHEVLIKPQQTLLEVLRDSLGFTGAKEGCGVGGCGACTVILDGVPALSCLLLVEAAVGKEILTIEGLAREGELHPIQESFVQHGAIQCGYCSPGMIMTGKAFLDQNPNPSREEIRVAIAGNLCRCTGYQKIVDAIEAVASTASHPSAS